AQSSQHLGHVTMTIPAVQGTVTVQMPAWDTLYQVRDFAYHVSDFQAANASASSPLSVTRLDKQTWRIVDPNPTAAGGEIRVEYNSNWDEVGPFATQVNSQHAFLNLAMILCYVP